MPALNEKDYAEFSRLLAELAPEIDGMKDTPKNFMRDMIEKNEQYAERMFVSPKQFDWVKKLHEEFVGNTDFEDDDAESDGDPRDRDEW